MCMAYLRPERRTLPIAAVEAEVITTVTAAVFLVFCCWLSGCGAVFCVIVVGGTVDGTVEVDVTVVV